MDQEMVYSYTPIRPDQIRLCRFMEDGDSVSAVLGTFTVDLGHPSYTALSYTWSSDAEGPSKRSIIRIGTKKLPVLDSLLPFFEALRSKGKLLDGTWWWIDSICIDQANVTERDEQVRRMRHIYEGASKVVVWLGDRSEDSDCALEFIHFLGKLREETPTREALRAIILKPEYDEAWIALKNFYLRGWWTRIWTIQEFVLPVDILFWCGERRISRRAVFDALMVADECGAQYFRESALIHYAFSRIRAWRWYRVKDTYGKPLNIPLLGLAAYFSNNEASDDRDRLYGLMGLSTHNYGLVIDYSRTVDEVYFRFAQSFIGLHKSLDIISFASLYPAVPGSMLPSWIPDWRARIHPLVVPLMVGQSSAEVVGNLRRPAAIKNGEKPVSYAVSGPREAVYAISGNSLFARGCVIDRVDGFAGSQSVEVVQSSGQHSQCSDGGRSAVEILTTICKALVLDRKDRYLQEPLPLQSYYDDFISLCMVLISQDPRSTPSTETVQRWFERTRKLLIHGRTLEDILCDIQRNNPIVNQSSRPVHDDHIQNSFYGRFFDVVERWAMRLMTSDNGRLGMVCRKAMKGDLICILFGCSVPMVLRKLLDKDEFTIVGECFLDGCMNGEALDQGVVPVPERTFCII